MADKEAWKNRIIKDLKEKDFNELISNTEDGIEILPFYTTDDNHKYQLEIPTTSYQDCLNTAIVKVSDASDQCTSNTVTTTRHSSYNIRCRK